MAGGLGLVLDGLAWDRAGYVPAPPPVHHTISLEVRHSALPAIDDGVLIGHSGHDIHLSWSLMDSARDYDVAGDSGTGLQPACPAP
jgi:hypothetical protein